MRTNVKETTYSTGDGQEFTNPAAAKKHEELCEARKAYENSKRELGILLAERCRTADGRLFDFGIWSKYYWITPGHFTVPDLIEIDFWVSNFDWRENREDESDTIVLIDYKNDVGGRTEHPRDFPINELFMDKSKAAAALRIAQLGWLEEKRREIEGVQSSTDHQP